MSGGLGESGRMWRLRRRACTASSAHDSCGGAAGASVHSQARRAARREHAAACDILGSNVQKAVVLGGPTGHRVTYIAAAEADTAFHTKGEKVLQTPNSPYESTAWAAVAAVRQDQAKTIIIMSKTGETARLVAKYRPDVPVVCICADQKVARQLMLLRGCHPVVMENVPAKHLFRRAVDCKPSPSPPQSHPTSPLAGSAVLSRL